MPEAVCRGDQDVGSRKEAQEDDLLSASICIASAPRSPRSTSKGELSLSQRIANDPRDVHASCWRASAGELQVALEATYGWEWLADLLEEAGYELHLAHPLRTKAIAAARVKTDAVDARTLAHLLRADLLPEAYVAPRELRDLRDLLRHRVALTADALGAEEPRARAPRQARDPAASTPTCSARAAAASSPSCSCARRHGGDSTACSR